MFPFDLDDEEDVVQEEDTSISQPTDYEIDFTTGELTGRVITGLPAIIQWIRLALGTERRFYNQFSREYGSDLETLIGKGYSGEYVRSEVKRMIESTLSKNEDIDGVTDMKVETDSDYIKVEFTVLTVYGSGEVSINV
jgi:hypothetical protein